MCFFLFSFGSRFQFIIVEWNIRSTLRNMPMRNISSSLNCSQWVSLTSVNLCFMELTDRLTNRESIIFRWRMREEVFPWSQWMFLFDVEQFRTFFYRANICISMNFRNGTLMIDLCSTMRVISFMLARWSQFRVAVSDRKKNEKPDAT